MSKHLAIIFSDLHIHDYKQFNSNGERLNNCLRVLTDIGDVCQKYGITTVFFSGDLYDTQKAILTKVINATVDAFIKFSKSYPDITIYAISGNHDYATKSLENKSAVSAIEHIASIVPDTFKIIDNSSACVCEGVYVYGVPYYDYPEHFEVKARELATDSFNSFDGTDVKRYLLIHQTPKGIGNEMIPVDCNPVDDYFSAFDHVFCGHIHKRQYLTEKFTVVGSPIHRDMGDVGETKGFLIMNLLKPEKGLKFAPLTNYPQFVKGDTVEFNADKDFVIPTITLEVEDDIFKRFEDFTSDTSPKDLLTNYWEEVGEGNKDLLDVGLSFL